MSSRCSSALGTIRPLANTKSDCWLADIDGSSCSGWHDDSTCSTRQAMAAKVTGLQAACMHPSQATCFRALLIKTAVCCTCDCCARGCHATAHHAVTYSPAAAVAAGSAAVLLTMRASLTRVSAASGLLRQQHICPQRPHTGHPRPQAAAKLQALLCLKVHQPSAQRSMAK